MAIRREVLYWKPQERTTTDDQFMMNVEQTIPKAPSGAVISEDGMYRYQLWRIWDSGKPLLNIIGLNPSTADAETNDPTLRRCMDFAKRDGFGGIYLTNLFAFRSPDPFDLQDAADPTGPSNDRYLVETAKQCTEVLLAWGNGGSYLQRDKEVRGLLKRRCLCLGITGQEQPRHPLYLKGDTPMVPFDTIPPTAWGTITVIEQIEERLKTLYSTEGQQTRPWWTKEVKRVFRELANEHGLQQTCSEDKGEWLYDCVWYTSEPYDGSTYGRTTSIPLVMECEWGLGLDAIIEDFDKLLLAHSYLSVMVCASYNSLHADTIIRYCETAVLGFENLAPGATFLLCIMPEEGNEMVFRTIVKYNGDKSGS